MRVLVTGGAGYIGSHTVLSLLAAGHDVLILDSFATSSPRVIKRLEALSGRDIHVIERDVRGDEAMRDVMPRIGPVRAKPFWIRF